MNLLLSVTFAWISTVSIFLLSIIYILRKTGVKNKNKKVLKINKKLRKAHIPISIIAIVTAILHGYFSHSELFSLNIGSLAIVIMIIMGILTAFRKKDMKFWIKNHRFLTLISVAMLCIHIYQMGIIGIGTYKLQLERVINHETPKQNQNSQNNDTNKNNDTNTEENTDDISNTEENKTETSKYKDGIYNGTANGYGPDLQTVVTVKNGKITKIEITNHNEKNYDYYGPAFETVPQKIIDTQSTDVDTVCGATYSSNGIIESVNNALSKQ